MVSDNFGPDKKNVLPVGTDPALVTLYPSISVQNLKATEYSRKNEGITCYYESLLLMIVNILILLLLLQLSLSTLILKLSSFMCGRILSFFFLFSKQALLTVNPLLHFCDGQHLPDLGSNLFLKVITAEVHTLQGLRFLDSLEDVQDVTWVVKITSREVQVSKAS
jgi:hypothetical protein